MLQHMNGQRQLLGGDTYFDLFHANFDVANLDLANRGPSLPVYAAY